MDQTSGLTRKEKKYLKKLITQTPKIEESQKVINQKFQKLKANIQTGDLFIQGKSQDIENLIQKKEDPSSIKFYLYTDRTKNREVYQEMKKLRQQYSHQKTSLVVQEVQKKIKDWTLKQQVSDKKRLEYFQQKLKKEQQLMQNTKKQKNSWRQMQQINHHQEVMKRLQKLRQKKQQREQQLKESQAKFKLTIQQVPLYIQKQRQYKQKLQEEQSRAKSLSKKNSISFESLNIKQHQKVYLQKIKERQQLRRQKSLSSLSRIRTPKYKNYKGSYNQSRINVISQQAELQSFKQNQNPQSKSQAQMGSKKFVTYFKLSEELKNQEQIKRQRRKEFINKIKELKPDQNILSRIKARKSQDKLVKQIQKKQKDKKVKPILSSVVKIGNQYLKQVTKNKQKQVKKMQNSVSLPTIKPSIPRYPNYLTQFKQKAQKSQRKIDEVQRVKRKYKQPRQLMEQLNKKSKIYQGTILRKIKQLQKTNKYDDQLKKQLQIDDLFYKSLKMRLACLQIS